MVHPASFPYNQSPRSSPKEAVDLKAAADHWVVAFDLAFQGDLEHLLGLPVLREFSWSHQQRKDS